MATTYCVMLENILAKTCLTKDALMAICPGADACYAQRVLKELEGSGHVRVKYVDNEDRGKTKRIKQFYITPAGVRFLAQMAVKDQDTVYESKKKTSYPWLKYVSEEDTKGMSVLGDGMAARERIAAVGEAAMLSELAGASVPFFLQDTESPISDVSLQSLSADAVLKLDKEIENAEYTEDQLRYRKLENDRRRARKKDPQIDTAKTAMEIMETAAASWLCETEGRPKVSWWEMRERLNYTGGRLLSDYPVGEESYIRFVHPTTVKYVALLNYRAGELNDKHDTDRGRYSGLLQSRIRTLLLYPVHKPTLSWPKHLSKAEMIADARWKKMLRPEFRTSSEREGLRGALLIQSPARFRKIWRDPIAAWRSQTELGFRFRHLYLLEIRHTGAESRRDIMLTGTEDYFRRETEKVLNEGYCPFLSFERNTDFYSDLFPVKAWIGEEWYYFMIGTRLDLRRSERMVSLMAEDTSFGCGVICEKWQHEYYKIMMPEAVTYWPGKPADEIVNDDYGVHDEE